MDSVSKRLKLADTIFYTSLLQAYIVEADSFENRNYNYRISYIRPDPLLRNRFHVNRKQRGESNISVKMWQPDYPAAQEQIKCPVFILGRRYDRMNQECYPDMKKQFIKTQVMIYLCPNGSHFSMWDDTQNYFREVIRFLRDVENNQFDPNK